jgi:hypothetical protein
MTITITVEKDGYYEVNGARQEPTVSLYVIPAPSRLRRMLKDTKDLIVCPGVYDGLSARIAMQVGFKGLYMVRTLIFTPISLHADLVHRLVLEQLHRVWEWPILDWRNSMT